MQWFVLGTATDIHLSIKIYFITHCWLISITMINQSLSVGNNISSNGKNGTLFIVNVPTEWSMCSTIGTT